MILFKISQSWCGRMPLFSLNLSGCICLRFLVYSKLVKVILVKIHKTCSHALHLTSSVILQKVHVTFLPVKSVIFKL